MVTITIDEKIYEVEAGKNLLETCQSLGLEIPYFCWHPALGSVGSCRQCAVTQYMPGDDNRERGKIVMSCMTPITDGLIVSLGDQQAKKFRSMLIETTMTNHPHDCPVCEEAGECHLQDMTLLSGHTERRYRGLKRTHNNQYLGPFINHEMNRCIACYRCVRFYRDYAGGTDLNVFGSRNNVYFGRAEDGVLENEFSGNLAEVCPTGVFTDKTLSEHYTRKWDLQSAPSICTHCSVGCNIYPAEHKGVLRRIQNRFNPLINGHFICDRGRFGYGFVNQESRLTEIWQRDAATQSSIRLDKSSAISALQKLLNSSSVMAIGSARSDCENNFALREAVGSEHYYAGLSAHELTLSHYLSASYQSGELPSSPVKSIESADAALLIGEDITQTAPVIALSLRQMTKNAGIEKASKISVQYWQAAAVKNITQELKSPVTIFNTHPTRLDDIAEKTVIADTRTLAQHIIAITAELNGSNANSCTETKRIAEQLRAAKEPAIITGINSQDKALFKATAELAKCLYQLNKNTRFVCALSQSNSMGQALLADANQDLDAAFSRIENNPPETLLILETDLYRYADKDKIDKALDKIKNIIVIEHTLTPTAQTADLLLPSTSFAESIGSWVNYEGRAQTAFAVFDSQTDRQPAWQWLSTKNHQDIISQLSQTAPVFASLDAMHADNHTAFKIARKPLRATGRTASYATVDIREKPPAQDEHSSYSFSPEGLTSLQVRNLIASDKDALDNIPPAYLWAPQWNSNEALCHFQDDINAPISGSHPGALLLTAVSNSVTIPSINNDIINIADKALPAMPYHNIFADDELSSYVPCMQKRAPEALIKMHSRTAASNQLIDGTLVRISNGSTWQQLALMIDDAIPADTVLLPSLVIAQLGQSVYVESV